MRTAGRERTAGTLGDDEVPVVDAADLLGSDMARRRVVPVVRDACLHTGFLCLDGLLGHSAGYRRLLRAMQEFFDLPGADPVKAAVDVTGRPDTRGWMPLYREPAYDPGTLARVESFDFGRPSRPGDAAERATNRWPALPGFREAAESTWCELTRVSQRLLETIGDALGMGPAFLSERCDTQDLGTMRLLHYPGSRPGVEDDADVGISAHTDFECITLISQTAAGLELEHADGRWYDVPAGGDRLVVLLGDMLERWTNGTVAATGHRVRSNTTQRYSVVLFCAVNDGVVVTPHHAFMRDGATPRYPPVGQREHSRSRIAEAERNRDELALARAGRNAR